MPKRQIVITEKTEGGYDWAEEGITADPKTGQGMGYKRDGVQENDARMYEFLAGFFGIKKAK